MAVITFEDYKPADRHPPLDTPWTEARIEESADGITWETVDTVTLDPVDEDPTDPTSRSFSTASASLEPGYYRIVWIDEDDNEQATSPVIFPPLATVTPADVAPHVIQYLRDAGGREDEDGNLITTFTDETHVTPGDVVPLIAEATSLVLSTLESPPRLIDPVTAERARRLIAIHAAISVIVTFYPEQIERSAGYIEWLTSQFTNGLTGLTAVSDATGMFPFVAPAIRDPDWDGVIT